MIRVEDCFEIGRIVRPQGKKGEVRVRSFAESREAFLNLLKPRVFLKSPQSEDMIPAFLEDAWLHKKFVILKFEGYDNISDAETLRDSVVMLPEEERNSLEPGEFYLDQLIGLQVMDAETGNLKGKVKDAFIVADKALLEIEKDDGRIFLAPFHFPLVREVRLDEKRILADFPEGLEEV